MKAKTIRKNHTHKPYIIYNAGGYFICDECGEEIYYTDLGLTWKDLIPYYEFYNDPTNSNYEDDKEAIEFFKEREMENPKED